MLVLRASAGRDAVVWDATCQCCQGGPTSIGGHSATACPVRSKHGKWAESVAKSTTNHTTATARKVEAQATHERQRWMGHGLGSGGRRRTEGAKAGNGSVAHAWRSGSTSAACAWVLEVHGETTGKAGKQQQNMLGTVDTRVHLSF